MARVGQSLYPFPLASPEERQRACNTLYKVAKGLRFTQNEWIYDFHQGYIPPCDASNEKIAGLSNELLIMVNEYHLMSLVHSSNLVSPIMPDGIER